MSKKLTFKHLISCAVAYLAEKHLYQQCPWHHRVSECVRISVPKNIITINSPGVIVYVQLLECSVSQLVVVSCIHMRMHVCVRAYVYIHR